MAGSRLSAQGSQVQSVSYANAIQVQSPGRYGEATLPNIAPYSAGNNNSAPFYRKIRDSHAEAERIRQQCRAASAASEARNNEVPVSLTHTLNQIDDALNTSIYARAAVKKDDSGLVVDRGAPAWLGHLTLPESDFRYVAKVQDDFLLPGVVDANIDNSEEVRRSSWSTSRVTTAGRTWPPSSASSGQVGFSELVPFPAPSRSLSHSRICDQMGSHDGHDRSDFSRDSSEDTDTTETETESSMPTASVTDEVDRWPPRPPTLRFKMRMQFSAPFKTPRHKEYETASDNLDQRLKLMSDEMKEPIVSWLNVLLALKVERTDQFEVGFPIIILTMLDAIYHKRVRWQDVDWRLQYKRALQKNYSVLQSIWHDVNMEKAREFRERAVRLDEIPKASLKDKLEFMKSMKRWFDQRIHSAGPFDPMQKRSDLVRLCKVTGHPVTFPAWVTYDETMFKERPEKNLYDQMPEFKRLIGFLGSTEHLTM